MAGQGSVLPIPIRRRKLMPPRLTGTLVDRPRLMDRLGQSLDLPLTLVIAPAGFGKTTLVRQWLAGIATPSAWLTVDASDVDERRFVTHLVAAIAAIAPIDPAHTLDLFQAPGTVSIADVAATLADDLFDVLDDIVIVLDDAQMATSPEVLAFLSEFLVLLPPSIHLVLVSRTDLPLSLARPRAQGLVNDLRAIDLRFTDEETEALVAKFAPVGANPATVALLQSQTEGWITGLKLATQALTLLRDPEQLIAAAEGEQHITQFLIEEVLANQSEEDLDFLLRTSIVSRLSAPLADALLDRPRSGSSQAMLERLVQTSLFLEPAADDGRWFRYHPLFRQLLRHQLARRWSPQAIAALHARAGHWFAGEELVDEAIAHLLETRDFEASGELVEHCLHLVLGREDWPSVSRWLRVLPDELVHGRPMLMLARGWVAHLSGRASPLRMILAEAEALVTASKDDPETKEAMRAEVGVLSLATLLPIERDPREALRTTEHALKHLPPDRRFSIGLAKAYQGLILLALGQEREAVRYLEAFAEAEAERIDAGSIRALLGLAFAHRQAANYAECADAARHLLTLAERNGLAVSAGWAHYFLGWLAYERDALTEANGHFAAIASNYRQVHLTCTREAFFGMALVFQAQGRTAEADAAIQRLTEIVIDASALEHLPVIHGFEARLALPRGQTDTAMRWLDSAEVTIDSNTFHAFEHALLTRVKTLLAEGSPESLAAAAVDLAALRGRAEAAHFRARLVEIWALGALLHGARGEDAAADEAMERALALAGGETFYRTFLDLGPGIRLLLCRTAERVVLPAHLQSLLLDQADDPPHETSHVARPGVSALHLLTPRECDVLDRLARRLSYQEIADELYISPGTVKRHVGSIYSKLDVGNRREAMIKAEALGWQSAS